MRAGWTTAMAVGAALAAMGCASTSPDGAYRDVASTVRERSGKTLDWHQDTKEDRRVTQVVDSLLAQPLSAESAVQIALLRSPHLQATLEELSVGQADLVQAGLLSNPVLTVGRTAWEQEHIDPNLFATVETSFLDLLTLPLKKRVASSELEATKLTVADEVLDLAAETRRAYFEALAAQQIAGVRQLVLQAADASAELARRQAAAGTMNDLALNAELGLASQANVDAARSMGAAAEARERLNQRMGVWGLSTRWTLPPRLPELPSVEVDASRFESRAVADRLDLAAARRQLQALGSALTLAKTTRWTGIVQVNVEAGRLRGSKRFSFGPSVGIEVPLFDQRQAAIARLEALQRQAKHELEAMAVDARAEVRGAVIRVLTARTVSEEYGRRLIPIRENLVRFSQQQYDAMLLGVYQLLQAKQAEFDSYRETIEAQRDYWIARSDLERAVGSRLPATSATAVSPAVKGTR